MAELLDHDPEAKRRSFASPVATFWTKALH